ncbi:amidohydrolase [Microbispora cellulosiformans]|uniref:Amidohydrolase n=2 Tax=Microbispora TaxID=2005 RepID=A0A5J5KA40_9ACTN|nr:amidohydrolase family protein [Microbispora cellulosiformans]KAA9381535.1 amidohydrolase [Microbispora cellulosiformans]
MSERVAAIDIVCNLFTPEVVRSRPGWTQTFLGGKVHTEDRTLGGLTLDQHVERLDEAGVERALLIAPKMGRVGLPESWQMDPRHVADAVQARPDRFSGLIGLDPYAGMRGVRELEKWVREYGFVGAHLYPHWFELPPDDARYYPLYAKCAELGVPIQMQVGHCLRYSDEHPLPSVGRPILLDTIACHFPELKILGIHIGWPWTEEMIAVAYKHPNVYIGVDAYAPRHWDPKLVHYANTFGQDKVLFGTDFPVIPHQRARTEIAELGLRPGSERKLLRDNALRVYDLP